MTWAPGQGVVTYPDGMGVPLKPTDKLVVQVHYNLADPGSAGKTDHTTVRLRFASSVTRALAFALPDGFLDTLFGGMPDSLPAGQAKTSYTWNRSGARPRADRPAVRRPRRGDAAHARPRLEPDTEASARPAR